MRENVYFPEYVHVRSVTDYAAMRAERWKIQQEVDGVWTMMATIVEFIEPEPGDNLGAMRVELPDGQKVRVAVVWPLTNTRVIGAIQALTTGEEQDATCGQACGYCEPYGFVPEAGCPVHDRE